jgi:radical SAM protein with 4Fe4S-binding SPASM domain
LKTYERRQYFIKAPSIAYRMFFNGYYDLKYDLMPLRVTNMPLSKKINFMRSGLNLVYRKLYPWSWPTHIHIELTNYCNLACRVCPTGAGVLKRQKRYIEVELFRRLIDEIGPYLMTASLWGWGEPLLHPQIGDILKAVHNRGIMTLLSTNGQNLNDEKVIDALLNYPPSYLIVAIDGITDETNRQFRVGAKLQPVLEGMRMLTKGRKERGSEFPRLHMRYIVMSHNEHEIPFLKDFAKENGFDLLTIRTLSIIDSDEEAHREMIPKNEKYRAYHYDEGRRVIKDDFICEKCFTFPAVFADGTVVACDQNFNAFKPLGVFSESSSFAEVWWSRQAAEVRKVIRNDPDKFSYCRNCPFRDRDVSTCSMEYHDLKAVE